MNKWKATSMVLVVLLGIFLIFNIALYQAANEEITKLKSEIVGGVKAQGNTLIINNDSFGEVYILSKKLYILDNGSYIVTQNRKFDVEVLFWGGYYSNEWTRIKVDRNTISALALKLNVGDSLQFDEKVTNGTPKGLTVRVFDENGYNKYMEVMKRRNTADMQWWEDYGDVLSRYQLASLKVPADTGAGFSLGPDSIRHDGIYYIVFENEGGPVVLNAKLTITKHIDVSSK